MGRPLDGSLADVFALQDKVTRSIADALALRLSPLEEPIARTEGDRCPRGVRRVPARLGTLSAGDGGRFREVDPLYSRTQSSSIPDTAAPYAALAMVYLLSYDRKWSDSLGISPLVAFQRRSNI
jgi:hypothetical protein